jgi:capsule biosynthesis phosphatase
MVLKNSIIIDLDNTISFSSGDYDSAKPNLEVISKIKEYRELGFEIIIHTSRNMRTYEGNIGKINIYTLPGIMNWLTKHEVVFDQVIVGKPWCGFNGFYVDDRSVRPDEFAKLTYEEISELIKPKK